MPANKTIEFTPIEVEIMFKALLACNIPGAVLEEAAGLKKKLQAVHKECADEIDAENRAKEQERQTKGRRQKPSRKSGKR